MAKKKTYSLAESVIQSMLIERDAANGIWDHYNIRNDGVYYYHSTSSRAARKGCPGCGRMICNFAGPNEISICLPILGSVPSEILSHLVGTRIRIYGSNDVSRAFPRIRLTPELARWLMIVTGAGIMRPHRGVLGWSPLPALWTMAVYPVFNQCRFVQGSDIELAKRLWKCHLDDKKNSVPNPCRDFLGNRS